MLSIDFIIQNKKEVEKAIKVKNVNCDLDKILNLDVERRELIQRIEKLRQERNKISEEFQKTKEKSLIENAQKIKKEISKLENKKNKIEENLNYLLLTVPNIISKDTPIGKDESDNIEIFKHGNPPKFDFQIKDHIEIGKKIDILDLERGVKVSGFRGYFLKNEGVLLHLGLVFEAIKLMQENGFTLFLPPTLLREFALIGSGHFPQGREDIYQILNPGKNEKGETVKEPIFLSGTAESPLLAYFANEILKEKDLPLKFCGFSQCYRSEVGSYGRDTKGLYRLHEFQKVEQVVICKNDIAESEKWLLKMRQISETLLQRLEMTYRVIQICSQDMGLGKYKMFDIETWMPSRNSYGETHSASNLTDWQTRRLKIRVKDKKGEKFYPFSLNNTVVASPRILIAILENNQQKDGSVKVPHILQKYVGKEIIKPRL